VKRSLTFVPVVIRRARLTSWLQSDSILSHCLQAPVKNGPVGRLEENGPRIFQVTVNETISVDRVRGYLASLTPQARASLLVEIERMLLYGEEVPGADLMLAQLRAEFRKSGQSSDRTGNPSRYFFKPIEALFVDRPPEIVNAGQISRGSLAAIWEWINQILLPTMARDYCDQMKRVIVLNNAREAKKISAAFQFKVVKYLEATLGSPQGIEGARGGLGKFTTSRARFDDLNKILAALQVRDALVAFNEALPEKIENLEGEALAKARGLLDAFAAKHPAAVPFALTMVMKRLKTPWQLMRFATEIAHGKAACDIAATRYAISITMVLDHLDDKRIALNHALKSNRIPIAKDILAEICEIEHALGARIAGFDKSEWGSRLDQLMSAINNDLQAEFQTLPDNVRHVLGSHTPQRPSPAPGFLTNLVRKGRDALVARRTN
jgi:hypothetical protein